MAESSQDKPPDPGDKPWERPWDTEQMRKTASEWSLAGDAGLLLHLQNFSQQLLAKTHDMQKKLNEVNREAKMTGVRMNNVLSDFIMLANKQFVENRVYDEDVSVVPETSQPAVTESQEKTQEQREAELIPKITEAITMGLNVIDTAFDIVDVKSNMADNDSNTHQMAPQMLTPKDPYSSRPLPYLIGSVGFMHEENLGLPYPLSEEEEQPLEEEVKDDVSVASASDEDDESKHPASYVATKQQNVPDWSGSASETESEGDLFDTHKDEDEDEAEDLLKEDAPSQQQEQSEEEDGKDFEEDKPSNFLDELANKFKEPGEGNSAKKEKSKPSNKTSRKDVSGSGDAIFKDVQNQAAEERSDEDDFLQGSGRFSSKVGLFDDDEDGDLFSAPAKTTVTKKEIKDTKPAEKPQKKASPTRGKSPAKASSLFGGSDSDDDDIFAAAAKSSSKSSSSTKSKGGGGGSLFGEDSASGSESKQEPLPKKSAQKDAPQKKVPKGAVPMFGGAGNPLITTLKKRQEDTPTDESGSDTDEDRRSSHPDTDTSSSGNADLAAAVTRGPRRGTRKKPGIQVLPTPTDTKRGGLFEEGDGQDIFASAPSGSSQRPSSASKAKESSKGGGAGGLFSDDDDLFSSAASSKTNSSSKTAKKEQPSVSGGSLFGADDDEDLFSAPSSVPSVQKKEVSKPKKQVLSLFDEEEEEDDIFAIARPGGSTKSSSSVPPPKQEKSHPEPKPSGKSRVFEDEDVLFGSQEEDPSVDLFGANSPLSSPTRPVPPKSQPKVKTQPPDVTTAQPVTHSQGGTTTKKPNAGLSLFDEEEEEDLFATKDISQKKEQILSKPSNKISARESNEQNSTSGSLSKEDRGARPKVAKENSVTKKDPSLFDEDDEEDLFSSMPAKPEPAPKNSMPTPPRHKPPTKKRPATNSPDKKPTEDPFLSEKTSTEAPLPQIGPISSKPAVQKESDVKSSDPFNVSGGKKGESHPVTKQPESSTRKEALVPSDDDDDLFSSDETDSPQETMKVAPPKQSPPAVLGLPTGAVSMFGGMDPSAILGKKFKPPPQVHADEDAGFASASRSGGSAAPEASAIPDVDFDQPAQAPSLQSATKTRAKIGSKRRPPTRRGRPQGGATGDSTGAASARQNTHPALASDNDVSDFFKDNTDYTLHNGYDTSPVEASRPSEVKGRGADPATIAAPNAVLDKPSKSFPTHTNSEENDIFADETRQGAMPDRPGKTETETPSVVPDQNSGIEDDIFSTKKVASKAEKNKDHSVRPKKVINVFEDQDIFADIGDAKSNENGSHLNKSSLSSRTKAKLTDEIESDIVGDNVSGLKEKDGGGKATKPKVETKSRLKADDLDIFGEPSGKSDKGISSGSTKQKTTATKQDDFDIFSDVSARDEKENSFADSSSKPKRATGGELDSDIFAAAASSARPGIVSDEDIFADSLSKSDSATVKQNDGDIFGKSSTTKQPRGESSSNSSSKSKSKVKSAPQTDDFDIFSGSSKKDEDLFACNSSESSGSKGSKSKKKPQVDLFADDTDIFSDLPPAKNKGTKAKKSTKSQPNIFSDDVDDIFATPKSTSNVPKSKPKARSSKTSVKSKAVVDDIFGDSSPSIFADPLSATKGGK